MTGKEYQKLAMRTNDGKATDRLKKAMGVNAPDCYEPLADTGSLLNGCLGLSGEVGEFNDMIKKWLFHEKPLDIEHAKKRMWRLLLVFGYDL